MSATVLSFGSSSARGSTRPEDVVRRDIVVKLSALDLAALETIRDLALSLEARGSGQQSSPLSDVVQRELSRIERDRRDGRAYAFTPIAYSGLREADEFPNLRSFRIQPDDRCTGTDTRRLWYVCGYRDHQATGKRGYLAYALDEAGARVGVPIFSRRTIRRLFREAEHRLTLYGEAFPDLSMSHADRAVFGASGAVGDGAV